MVQSDGGFIPDFCKPGLSNISRVVGFVGIVYFPLIINNKLKEDNVKNLLCCADLSDKIILTL